MPTRRRPYTPGDWTASMRAAVTRLKRGESPAMKLHCALVIEYLNDRKASERDWQLYGRAARGGKYV